ncbi:MAG: DUF2959 domain-containing protein [Pseudomonadota bacterium]
MNSFRFIPILVVLALTGCASAYYGTMEKVGYHKRDILVDRVESARDAQTDAQEQFKSALDQFASVIQLKDTGLKQAYEKLNNEYEDCESAANEVSERIEKVESVADALFGEWQDELALYQNQSLKASSSRKLKETKNRYRDMLKTMKRAESTMQPVLNTFRDNVLFLKHNLNALAIGALRGEFSSLKADISRLIEKMNLSIEHSTQFIQSLQES